MDIDKLPPNSHQYRQEMERKKVEKVVSGTVTTKKKSLGRRFADIVLSGDLVSVKEDLKEDFLEFGKETALKALEMLLWGDSRASTRRKVSGRSNPFPYSSISRGNAQQPKTDYSRVRSTHNFDDIVLESRGDAEQVLDVLCDMLETYGQVTVADLYDAVGKTSRFSDNNYGWTNLQTAYVSRVRQGYLLNMPKCVQLD
jgi:hypothetical protein